jgi:predicted nucleotidyltransferase
MNHELLRREADAHPYPLLFATVSGAHLYGFPSPDSDFDLRGVHILPLREAVGLRPPRETVTTEVWRDGLELDLVTHDIHKFFRLLLKKNGYVLEQLYSPLIVRACPEHAELKEIANRCVTRFHAHHYFGFAANQWKLFAKEDPPRVKPLLYVYRVLLTGIHLMRTGRIEANLEVLNEDAKLPFLPDLLARKRSGPEKGVLSSGELAFHAERYAELVNGLEAASAASQLPAEPSAADAPHDLLVRVRLGNP